MHSLLSEVYGTKGKEQLQTMERSRHSALTSWLLKSAVVLAVLSGLAWAGFFLYHRGTFQTAKALEISIEGPDRLKGGEEVAYTVKYKNESQSPIAGLHISLHIPPTFKVEQTDPPVTEGRQEWNVGAVDINEEGTLQVKGRFLSTIPSRETLQALAVYKPANFSSEFEQIETMQVNIPSSIIQISLTGEEQAVVGEPVTYTVSATNDYHAPSPPARVSLELPEGFSITASDPAFPEPGMAAWPLETLAANETRTFHITGLFSSGESRDIDLKATASFVTDNIFVFQASSQITTAVIAGNLGVTLVVDGKSTDQSSTLGESLLTSITYENQGAEPLSNLSLTLKLEGADGKKAPVDRTKIDAAGGVLSGDTITWTATERPEFATLAPGATGVIDVVLPLAESISEDQSDQATFTATGSITAIGAAQVDKSVSALAIRVALLSDLLVTTHARYFDASGAPIGSGSLPPKINETTTYRIEWDLGNTLHPLSNTTVSTTLPKDIHWTEQVGVDQGTITFDEITRVIRWHIDKLPAQTTAAHAWFDLSTVPSEAQIGTFLRLTNATSIEAKDDEVNDRITGSLEGLTSELVGDAYAGGKGVVVGNE